MVTLGESLNGCLFLRLCDGLAPRVVTAGEPVTHMNTEQILLNSQNAIIEGISTADCVLESPQRRWHLR